MNKGPARISHQLSDNSHTLSSHLGSQQVGAVLHEHCPQPTVSQSAATGEQFVQRSGEKCGLSLFSPAKINLFLRILRKRPDGFHELASLFQTINLGDTLTFSLADQDRLTCSDPALPCDHSNLVTKAVDLFRSKTGLQFSINIHLNKRIPIQAGLGGGSSNAATTLWALNALHNHPVSEKELQIWSAEIGSDIPFFFSCGTAYCTGRGENVRDLPPINLPLLTVTKPKEGLSTPAIYNALKLNECSTHNPQELLESFYSDTPLFINDLERPAFRLCPPLQTLKKRLLCEGQPVFMTGSGTAFVTVGSGEALSISRPSCSWYPHEHLRPHSR